jgi:site-specific recombinase XerD
MVVSQPEAVSWDQVIEAFLFSRRAIGISQGMLELYSARLRIFRDFHFEHNLPCQSPLECTPHCIEAFFVYLAEHGRRMVTVCGYFRELRTFFKWLKDIGLKQDYPIAKVKPPKPEHPLPRTVTEDHFLATIRQLDLSKPLDLRYAVLFTLLFDTGARVSEILQLRVGDVDLKNRLLRIKGKGNKERIIPFGRTAATLLSKYMSLLATYRTPTNDDLVFQSSNFTPLHRRNIYRRWQQLQKQAGLKPLPLHGLRHGFARAWLISGGDAFSLQLILGHASPETTKRYVTLWASDLQQKHAQHSPVDRLTLVKIKER